MERANGKKWKLAAAVITGLLLAFMETVFGCCGSEENSESPQVALTFDDGPHPVYT